MGGTMLARFFAAWILLTAGITFGLAVKFMQTDIDLSSGLMMAGVFIFGIFVKYDHRAA